jgi:hypothetical protein
MGYKMKCPYMIIESGRKTCKHMIEQGLDEELDDFDLTHYCEGNPHYCFFFRFFGKREPNVEQPEQDESAKPMVSLGAVALDQPLQPAESSEKSDILIKLKRFFHHNT